MKNYDIVGGKADTFLTKKKNYIQFSFDEMFYKQLLAPRACFSQHPVYCIL